MKAKIVCSLGASLTIFCTAFFAGSLSGQEAASVLQSTMESDSPAVSCTGWMNCDSHSPNFTGFCCRCCTDKTGSKRWECRESFAKGPHRRGLLAGHPPAGEATLAGIVTREGLLQAEDGLAYAVAGEKAEELHRNMGRKIEVKGTVEEVQGRATIEVKAYELLGSGTAGAQAGLPAAGAFGSCTGWMNCDPRPPTYTGTCCRECEDNEGAKLWDCRVFSVGEHSNMAERLRPE